MSEQKDDSEQITTLGVTKKTAIPIRVRAAQTGETINSLIRRAWLALLREERQARKSDNGESVIGES